MSDNKRYFYIQAQKKKNVEKALNGGVDSLVAFMEKPSNRDDLSVYYARDSVKSSNQFDRKYNTTMPLKKLPSFDIKKQR